MQFTGVRPPSSSRMKRPTLRISTPQAGMEVLSLHANLAEKHRLEYQIAGKPNLKKTLPVAPDYTNMGKTSH